MRVRFEQKEKQMASMKIKKKDLIDKKRISFAFAIILIFCVLTVFVTSCFSSLEGAALSKEALVEEENLFLSNKELSFEALPFEQIKSEHFMPAFLEAFQIHQEEIKAIAASPQEPTFENTIIPFEYSGMLLEQVASVFYHYLVSLSDEDIEAIAEEIEPMYASHMDNITLDKELFQRVKHVYEKTDRNTLSQEDVTLLENTYNRFIDNGALIHENEQERFREINQRLASAGLAFWQNVMADVQEFELLITNEEELKGLPDALIESAEMSALQRGHEEGWLFTLQGSSAMGLLTHSEHRDIRQKINEAYIMRGGLSSENDNQAIIHEIINLRIERANLLGYSDYASFALKDSMLDTPEAVHALLIELWAKALPAAKSEARILQDTIAEEGEDFSLAYWDWRYYAEKTRQQKYFIDESIVRQYFEANQVVEGAFMVMNKLWGLRFVRREDLSGYHPDVTAWEVQEADGTYLGILYVDLYARDGKQSGAWARSLQCQYVDLEGKHVYPVVSIACNFAPPSEKTPSLLSLQEVRILFHEFGHALHMLLSDVHYPSLSGTAVPRDFLELPSQIMEHWATELSLLPMFAKHYESGETIPQELLLQIEKASGFNQGFTMLEMLASALLDYHYHQLQTFEDFDIYEFEARIREEYNMPEEIYFRHGSTHFLHIFTWGYDAAYYSYLWSGVLDADSFEAFIEAGDLFDHKTAERFRKEILEKGGTCDPMQMYIAFRGREPVIEPLLRNKRFIR